MEVIGYARVSTDEQAINGISLDAQAEKIRAYCTAKGWELCDLVRDEGISAKNLNRPGLQSILEQIPKRNGKRGFDGLVVCKLDRLTRSVGDLGYLNKLFDKNRVSFISIQENVDTSTASGKLFHHIIASLSEWERGVIAERTKDALRHLRTKGKRTGSVRYGFILSTDGKTLQPDAKEQAVLRQMKALQNKQASYRAIAKALNKQEIPTKQGKVWGSANVYSVLKYADKS
jgi:DNA invertase Pin-like site-specific DNA recombinase